MPTHFDDETLVAFLDGELEREQIVAIESELGSDPQLQQRVASLRQTWDLLGDLPEPTPSRDLAQSTIELVTLELDAKDQSFFRRILRNKSLLLSLGCLLAIGLGTVTGQLLSRVFAGHLKRNLPVIANYAALREIDSEEWLDVLREIDYLETAFPGDAIGDREVPARWSDRETWIQELDEIDRGLLQDNAREFIREPDEKRKQQLRQFMESIRTSDDSPELLAEVRSYAALLDSRSGKQKEALKSMDIAERREQVQLIVNFKMRTIYAATMSEEDRVTVERWLLTNDLLPDDVNELMFDGSFILDSMMEDLIVQLSEQAQNILEPQTIEDQRLSLGYWVTSVVFPDRREQVSTQQMIDILKKLGSDQRTVDELDRIELLPEEQAQRELRRLASQQKTGD